MNRGDVLNLIGASQTSDADYVPVASLLNSGYGCVGYFNHSINQNLLDTLVLLNARLVDLRADESNSRRGRVADFNDFLQDVVADHVRAESKDGSHGAATENAEGTIPLTAIPLREISMLYPVAHIATLLQSARHMASEEIMEELEVPTFLDFNNKSIVLKALRTKLW